jgi:hypothetical protein
MRKIKVIINYSYLSVPHLIEFSRNTVTKMTANVTIFATPDVTLTLITAAAATLELKYNAAQGGGKQQTIELKVAHAALLDLLRKQALYVDRIANGNEGIIVCSGFAASKQPTTSSRPDFSVENGDQDGVIELKHKAMAGVKSWVWQYSNDPTDTNKWVLAGVSTQSTFTIEDLTPGDRYWFRVAAVYSNGQDNWCEPLSQIVT